jgi:hypothetical protein
MLGDFPLSSFPLSGLTDISLVTPVTSFSGINGMSLSNRKRIILVKIEPTYGIDSVPTAPDAVLCSTLEITPLEGTSVERSFIRPYFGASGSIRVENFASVAFETEIAGSGTAGTAPEWASLIKAANFSETITAAPVTGACSAAGTLSTIVLAASASVVDNFYTGMTVTITAGTGNGQSGEIVNYVGATKTATISKPWAIAPVITASTYSIGANVIYTPNSNFGASIGSTSASIYFNVDGVRHILLGARGTCSFDISVKQIPKIKWKFTGLLGTVADITLPTADFTGWQTPVTVSTENTTDISLLGYNGAVVEKLTFDIANEVKYRQLIGSESVIIGDRKPSGSVTLEAVTVGTKDWWSIARNSSTGVFCIKHGQTAGNIVGFTAPKVQLKDPKYAESDGVTMMDFGMEFIPYSASGNDELRICCK